MIFGFIVSLMLAAFLVASVYKCVSMLREARGWRRWTAVPSSALVAIGALGFFGAALSSVGALNWLPASFEWPAGHTSALTAADGSHIVLLSGADRIQVYDPQWRFVRGWPVPAALNLRQLPDGTVEVLAKGGKGLIFNGEGQLLARQSYGVHEFVDLENSLPPQTPVFIPTSPALYVFSSPFLSGLTMFIGFLGWYFART